MLSTQKVMAPREFKAILVDLDDTLYRVEAMSKGVRSRIQDYMVRKLNIPLEEVEKMTVELYTKYGTTMAGLAALGYELDYDDFHEAVHHSLPYSELLATDSELRSILQSIPYPKYILTNADMKHAEICLDILGIRDCFKDVFSFETVMQLAKEAGCLTPEVPVMCKPNAQTYKLVLDSLKLSPGEVAFLDDSVRNICSAHQLGIFTVLVGTDTLVPGADVSVVDLHQLPIKIPSVVVRRPKVSESATEQMEKAYTISVQAS